MRSDNLDDGGTTAAETERAGAESRSTADRYESGPSWPRRRARRLRLSVARFLRARDVHTAIGFVLVGAISFAGGVLVPDGREVLFALAGVGLFAGVVTYSLTVKRAIEATDAARVYVATARNCEQLAAALDLSDQRLYAPVLAGEGGAGTVELFVPASADADRALATAAAHATGVDAIDADRSGARFEPTGTEFVRELADAGSGALPGRPGPLVERLADALVARFELVSAADPVVDADEGRASIAVSDSALGPVDRFDHPVASILAVGLAAGLREAISLEVTDETDRGEWLVTCRWGEAGPRQGE